jgi:hypothetical protein
MREHHSGLLEPQTADHEEARVVLAVKTPLDARAVTAGFPAEYTIGRAITEMRKSVPQTDRAGHEVLDNVERELKASHANFLIVRPNGVVLADRQSKLRDVAQPREMRTPVGLKTVPAVAVEVQAYANVGAGA